ncbi:hypothetical protein ACOMDM_09935 [Serratia plymuthica]|uniref:hypothetical protein n=1 Tax=Serratia plymuthica TaxID=82996 RepID=UPI003B9E7053
MSIKVLLNDAFFLQQTERNESALTLICVAIAASSRKRFPIGTQSIKKPTTISKKKVKINEMGDREAFILFFNDCYNKMFLGASRTEDAFTEVTSYTIKNKNIFLSDILYKHYRCQLVHEGGLNSESMFIHDVQNPNLTMNTQWGEAKLKIENDRVILSYGWFEVLVNLVYNATVNGDEFDINYHGYKAIENCDEKKHRNDVSLKYGVDHADGAYRYFIDMIGMILNSNNEAELNYELTRCRDEGLNLPAFEVYLDRPGLSDDGGKTINKKGFDYFKEYFSIYQYVKLN